MIFGEKEFLEILESQCGMVRFSAVVYDDAEVQAKFIRCMQATGMAVGDKVSGKWYFIHRATIIAFMHIAMDGELVCSNPLDSAEVKKVN